MSHSPDGTADHFLDQRASPFHRGILPNASHSTVERSRTCGDEVHLQLRLDSSIVTTAWFNGRGCFVSQAAASILCERIDGQPIQAAMELTDQEVLSWIGIPLSPTRRSCALLAFRGLQRILALPQFAVVAAP